MSRDERVRLLVHTARRQGLVVTRRDALNLGASDDLLGELTKSGVFVRLHPGVYGLAGATQSHAMAARAALAAVGRGVASHGTAVWLAGMADTSPAQVHLTTGGEQRHRLRGVVTHRSATELPWRAFRGIRCTTVARTLVDWAATASPSELAAAVDQALSKRLVRVRDLAAEVEMADGRRGCGRLRRCLDELGYIGAPAPSVLESRMLRLFKRHGLSRPKVEVRAGADGRYRIDFAFPALRLAIEVYGYGSHHSPGQMQHDHARQRHLVLQGWTVLVFTWRDVVHQPDTVASQILAALAQLSR
ncbi:MAG: DUF559 domain-containing protein [Acidimicrobiales bacterium]|nr:DUF559 domain-containing protein [Acidimicrobiales bacterium]